MTEDPKTKEFMMIMQFADKGNLRDILLNNFNSMSWKDKIKCLKDVTKCLKHLHDFGYPHKNFHSRNIFQCNNFNYALDFGLSGPSDKQKSNDEIYGVLPYIAPEVLNGELYTSSSD